MNTEDREFLKALQHEMLTQDTVAQASPRFWVVMQTVRDYWVEDNEDGFFIVEDGECVFESKDGTWTELGEWLQDLSGVTECKSDDYDIELQYNGSTHYIDEVSDLERFLDEHSPHTYMVGQYREREEICQNTFFLTLRECHEHIEANRHHYTKPHSYAMTAWRSPQVKRLFEILEKVDWDQC